MFGRKFPCDFIVLNPLTPVPPATGRDKPWPFFEFLFWRYHVWPKLASSMLNFCRRKRSFQWCPDQSDRLNGVRDMDKNAQKVERKNQSKISCHYTWLLHAKNCPSRSRFLRSFLTPSKPSRRSFTAAKRKGEVDVGHFLVQKRKFWFLRMPESHVVKRDADRAEKWLRMSTIRAGKLGMTRWNRSNI